MECRRAKLWKLKIQRTVTFPLEPWIRLSLCISFPFICFLNFQHFSVFLTYGSWRLRENITSVGKRNLATNKSENQMGKFHFARFVTFPTDLNCVNFFLDRICPLFFGAKLDLKWKLFFFSTLCWQKLPPPPTWNAKIDGASQKENAQPGTKETSLYEVWDSTALP